MNLEQLTRSIRDKEGNRLEQVKLATSLFNDEIETYFPKKEQFILTFLFDRLKEDGKNGEKPNYLSIEYWDLLRSVWSSGKVSKGFMLNCLHKQALIPLVIKAFDSLCKTFRPDVFNSICLTLNKIYDTADVLYATKCTQEQASLILSKFLLLAVSTDSQKFSSLTTTLKLVQEIVYVSFRGQTNPRKAAISLFELISAPLLSYLSATSITEDMKLCVKEVLHECCFSVLLDSLSSSSEASMSLLNTFIKNDVEPVMLLSLPELYSFVLSSIELQKQAIMRPLSTMKASDLTFYFFAMFSQLALSPRYKTDPFEQLKALDGIVSQLAKSSLRRGAPDESISHILDKIVLLSSEYTSSETVYQNVWQIFVNILDINFDAVFSRMPCIWTCASKINERNRKPVLSFFSSVIESYGRARSLHVFCKDWFNTLQGLSNFDNLIVHRHLIDAFATCVGTALSTAAFNDLLREYIQTASNHSLKPAATVIIASLIKSLHHFTTLSTSTISLLKDFYSVLIMPFIEGSLPANALNSFILMAHFDCINLSDEYSHATSDKCLGYLQSLLLKAELEDSVLVWALQCYFGYVELYPIADNDTEEFAEVLKLTLTLSTKLDDTGSKDKRHSITLRPLTASKAIFLTMTSRWLKIFETYEKHLDLQTWFGFLLEQSFLESGDIDKSSTSSYTCILLRMLASSEVYEQPSVCAAFQQAMIKFMVQGEFSSYMNEECSQVFSGNWSFLTQLKTIYHAKFILNLLKFIPIESIKKGNRSRFLNAFALYDLAAELEKDVALMKSLRKAIFALSKLTIAWETLKMEGYIMRLVETANNHISLLPGTSEILGHWFTVSTANVLSPSIRKVFSMTSSSVGCLLFLSLFFSHANVIQKTLSDDKIFPPMLNEGAEFLFHATKPCADGDEVSKAYTKYYLGSCINLVRLSVSDDSLMKRLSNLRNQIELVIMKYIDQSTEDDVFPMWISLVALTANSVDDCLRCLAYLAAFSKENEVLLLSDSDIRFMLQGRTDEENICLLKQTVSLCTHIAHAPNELAIPLSSILRVLLLLAQLAEIPYTETATVSSDILHTLSQILLKNVSLSEPSLFCVLKIIKIYAHMPIKSLNHTGMNHLLLSLSYFCGNRYKGPILVNSNEFALELISILTGLLYNHRSYINGRFHVLFAVLKGFLVSFTRTQNDQKSQKEQGRFKWLPKNSAFTNEVANGFTRLVTIWMNPNLMHDANKRTSVLSNADKLFTKASAKHFLFLLLEFMNYQIWYTYSPDIKEALLPGFNAIYENLSTHEKESINAALDASSRVVYKNFVNDWSRFSRWVEQ
ncbi:ribosome biogenesis protein Urb2 [Schizosaccharomyces japonicus yFS275]|uniref:Ribosome biogenesis protein Urb2 n=1 Tax=Schizosaccharomyces japonicus (strain yFS275 / FY16936) TaxID=402676 RepID=B6K5B8_SCHJY|nr:ribosome biogenesis protein Urb2 [Schizosaccharomyces japonicus yFS275]EEB08722.1 ribosome biogenesis protein Urb2 [Schizosaccharomyces japonicus yFS275]